MNFLRRYFVVLMLGFIILVNAVVMAGVAYNRSGEPVSTVTLTGREVQLQRYRWGVHREDTGMSLRLRWSRYPFGKQPVLNRGKLIELGFDPEQLLPKTERFTGWRPPKAILPRTAYVVFEYGGPAWDELLQYKKRLTDEALKKKAPDDRTRKSLQEGFDRFQQTASRLVLVDAGLDPAKLRQRYLDRQHFLIVKAKIRVYRSYRHDGATKRSVRTSHGVVSSLLPATITVPYRIRKSFLAGVTATDTRGGAKLGYDDEVTIDFGKRYEPWVVSMQVMSH